MDGTVVAVALLASIGPTLVGYAAYQQAKAANRAVNNVGKDEPRLVEKVDTIGAHLTHVAAEQQYMRGDVDTLTKNLREGVARLRNVELASFTISQQVDGVAAQATEAATLARAVKRDFDLGHKRADAVPPDAEPGTASDAAHQTPKE